MVQNTNYKRLPRRSAPRNDNRGMSNIKLKINDKEIECESGQTIMEAALANDIYIPGLCGHPDFPHKANCRVCVVEIDSGMNPGQGGQGKLMTSCSTLVREGMIVKTDTDRVKKSRNLNIELIFAEHIEKCATCIWRVNCKLLDLADRYKILLTTFKDRKGKRKTYRFSNAVEIDGTQCIDCRNCIDACSQMQKINYLELQGKGVEQEIIPTGDKKIDCIYCGQCALHCPVGSAQEQSSWEDVEKALKDGKKTVVAQISSAALVSIGEEFKEPADDSLYKKIYSALRQLGFKYVFDDSLPNVISAARGALGILNHEYGQTIITSSCPAWVKYAHFYRPELEGKFLNLRSPHMIGGGIIKSYLAKEKNINKDDLTVVSILPCTAAKFEIERKELKEGGKRVDHVLTVRELAWMIKKNRIELNKLAEGEKDTLTSEEIKAPMMGASGGETEMVFQTANYLSNSKKNDKLEQEKGILYAASGVKEIAIEIPGRIMHVAVVNGIGNIIPVLDNLKKYDFIEVMACPGGCAGGGGQAFPTNDKLRKQRLGLLRGLDKADDDGKMQSAVLDWLEKNNLENETLYKVI